MLHFNIFTAMVDMVLLGAISVLELVLGIEAAMVDKALLGAIRILELVLLIETGNFLL